MSVIETDLNIIASQAEIQWANNWNFRSYLQQEVSPESIDAKVAVINQDISSAIDCTACGNCCREIFPYMTDHDVTRLAQGLRISKKQLVGQTQEIEGERIFCQKPCPLLRNSKCTVYAHRPQDCRDYPHLDKPDFLAASVSMIENYRVCPIVFNVYNALKKSFDYKPTKNYIGDVDPETYHGSTFKG